MIFLVYVGVCMYVCMYVRETRKLINYKKKGKLNIFYIKLCLNVY